MTSNDVGSPKGNGIVLPYYGKTEGDAVTQEFIRDFGHRWEDAWNSYNVDQVMELIHPDIRWNDTIFWPEMIYGQEAMRAYVEKVWAVMPDCRFREVQLFTAPEDGRALYLFEQITSAPPAGRTEQKATTYGCDIFLGFRDGLLSDYMAQYEITEMMRQFGMLPSREGRVGGAYLLSLMGPKSVKD